MLRCNADRRGLEENELVQYFVFRRGMFVVELCEVPGECAVV